MAKNLKLKEIDVNSLHLLPRAAQVGMAIGIVILVWVVAYFALFRNQLAQVDSLKEEEVKLNENVENLFELDFTGLGNSYNSKTVNKKVVVNESVVQLMDAHKFYTDGKNIFAIKKHLN